MDSNIANIISSLKGISGSGGILGQVVKGMTDYLMTLEPGDIVRDNPPLTMAAPIAFDAWYLNCHANFMAKYYDTKDGTPATPPVGAYKKPDGDHFDYKPYMAANLSFLQLLPGLKPLKVLRDLEQITTDISTSVFGKLYSAQYENNGIYWINTMAFELWKKGQGFQYASPGPKDFKVNDYIGYIAFPIGQLGVQEVISLIQETDLSGYKFTAVDNLSDYWPKVAIVDLEEKNKPIIQSTPEIFPDMKDSNGNALAGKNYCFGRHLVENAYVVPDTPAPSQNKDNSSNGAAYAPTPKMDVELLSKKMEKYQEDVWPKFWMRYWIHKDSTLPVPGEFIGILCRPVACPPHVWWFQESSPFLYAGNWVETGNLSSGVVTVVTLEADRTDGGIGSQYHVKVQGCEVKIDSSDFLEYSVGDRVAVLKVDSTIAVATKSFTWLDQPTFKDTDKMTKKTNCVIVPCTFCKKRN